MYSTPKILKNGLIAVFICIILVWLSYSYIDKPVAFWVYNEKLPHHILFQWFTYLSSVFMTLVFFIYISYLIRFAYYKIRYFDNAMLLMATSIVIASYIKNLLKFVFGRTWIVTWINNNPSLIKDNIYGFNFFHGGVNYSSFPSGHTAVIVAAMASLWWSYPRFRWLYIVVIALVVIGLIGMDYHFVSDVIAGGFLGGLVSYYTMTIASKNK